MAFTKKQEEEVNKAMLQEPPKNMEKETLEEVAESKYLVDIWEEEESLIRKLAFSKGVKWQQERIEEDMRKAFIEGHNVCRCVTENTDEAEECFEEWFAKFKNK
jgi:hypothetical protein